MHNCNFCTLNVCPISVAVVINSCWHPSAFWTASSLPSFIQRSYNVLLAGSSRWEESAQLRLPSLPEGGAALSQGQDWCLQGEPQSRAHWWASLPLWEHPLAELDIALLFLMYLAYSIWGFVLLFFIVVLLFFFYIHCSNNQYSKDFLCVCCSCAEVTSRYTCEQSLTVLLQLQATGCEMSSLLRLVPLNVKKSKHHLILCRATAVFFKDSETWFEVLHCAPYEKKVILFLSFLQCFACAWTCFEDYLPQEEQKKSTVQVPPVLSASPSVYLLWRSPDAVGAPCHFSSYLYCWSNL